MICKGYRKRVLAIAHAVSMPKVLHKSDNLKIVSWEEL